MLVKGNPDAVHSTFYYIGVAFTTCVIIMIGCIAFMTIENMLDARAARRNPDRFNNVIGQVTSVEMTETGLEVIFTMDDLKRQRLLNENRPFLDTIEEMRNDFDSDR